LIGCFLGRHDDKVDALSATHEIIANRGNSRFEAETIRTRRFFRSCDQDALGHGGEARTHFIKTVLLWILTASN
jgi:hypothetical protein